MSTFCLLPDEMIIYLSMLCPGLCAIKIPGLLSQYNSIVVLRAIFYSNKRISLIHNNTSQYTMSN